MGLRPFYRRMNFDDSKITLKVSKIGITITILLLLIYISCYVLVVLFITTKLSPLKSSLSEIQIRVVCYLRLLNTFLVFIQLFTLRKLEVKASKRLCKANVHILRIGCNSSELEKYTNRQAKYLIYILSCNVMLILTLNILLFLHHLESWTLAVLCCIEVAMPHIYNLVIVLRYIRALFMLKNYMDALNLILLHVMQLQLKRKDKK